MLQDYGLEDNLETVRKWYDGYLFGESEVYNPWSVINYVNSCYGDKRSLQNLTGPIQAPTVS